MASPEKIVQAQKDGQRETDFMMHLGYGGPAKYRDGERLCSQGALRDGHAATPAPCSCINPSRPEQVLSSDIVRNYDDSNKHSF